MSACNRGKARVSSKALRYEPEEPPTVLSIGKTDKVAGRRNPPAPNSSTPPRGGVARVSAAEGVS